MKYKSVRGTRDILPEEVWKWQYVEDLLRRTFDSYGYREIRIPVFEQKELFERSIGGDTDIVNMPSGGLSHGSSSMPPS